MNIKIPEGLEERLLSSIDHWEQEELAHKPHVRRLWYAAAACVLLAFVGGTWFLQDKGNDKPQTPPTVEVKVEERQQTNGKPQNMLAQETKQAVTPPEIEHNKSYRPKDQAIPHKNTTESTHIGAVESSDENLYLTLLTEVEARAFKNEQLEQQSIQAIFDELIENIEQQPNLPELIL